ncbi:MAG TPA: VanZ family protein [Puia sp.]
MRHRLYQIFSNRLPALLWTIIVFILLALPGNMLPNENHLAIPNLDKYVHIILFGSFVFLWSFYYGAKQEKNNNFYRRSVYILIIACLYGTAMEYVQKYFIPNRYFDIYDIAADVAGAVAGFLIIRLTFSRFRNS